MKKQIKTQLPNPDTFKDSLGYHYSGRWYVFVSLLGVFFLWFGNIVNNNSQKMTLYVLTFCCLYLIIPASLYMKNYYQFFINSWLMGFLTLALYAYIVVIILYRLEKYMHSSIYIYAILFIFQLIDKRKNYNVYLSMIKKSTDENIFYIEKWFNNLEESEVDQGMGFALWIGVAVGAIVILVGTVFGGGLMTAKVLLNSSFDMIVEFVVGFGMFAFSMYILTKFTNETLKLTAAYEAKTKR